ncbi:ABC transporter permease [Paraburkholderia largidicola]|uniref:Ribose import permease protein RbsC n=1 Tax=Paraburkholderia largidicola TaxID=3014751 RepID=A0A7I8C1Y0_9BURK|nr:ABC transporter permease [Paraburkholderia sp. PGU16]BCF95042.1 ribose import permease protein RbsC [Paraburkholderia sp. PGU16]
MKIDEKNVASSTMMSSLLGPKSRLIEGLRQSYGLIQAMGVLILLVLILSLLSPRFLTWINIYNLMGQMAVALIVAAGMTVVMISGEFDISVGSVVALSAAVSATLMPHIGVVLAILVSLLVGPVLGLFSGLVVTRGHVPSFIATLGMMMIARSLAFVTTGGQVISNLPDAFTETGQGVTFGVPNTFLIAVLCYGAGWVLMTRTTFGKKVYAVGANRNVAVLSGIRADRVKIICLMIVGLSASFAGNLLLSRVGAIQADTAKGLEFEVIAAVVIGGTSLSGGQGNILRTIIGVVTIALIRNFLNLSRIDIFWQDFATGAIILGAVLLDVLQKRIAGQVR